MKRSFLCLLALALWAQSGQAGIFYRANNRSEGGPGSAADWQVAAWVDGDNARVEFTESGNPLLPGGSYLLTTDGGQTVVLVNTEQGTYSRWDIEAMLRSVHQIMESTGGMLSMTIRDSQVELLLEEAGGELLGHATTHYSYRTAYEMQLKVLGMKRRQMIVTDQEIWSTDDFGDPGMGMWLRQTPANTGDGGFDALIEVELDKMKGFPLKTVTTTTTTGKKGRATTTKNWMEVTELREESVAAETFVLDPDLVEQPMPLFGAPADGEENEGGGLRGLLKRSRGGG